MHFKEHLAGGGAAALISTAAVSLAGPEALPPGFEPMWIFPPQAAYPALCLAAALGMALFPDLDTASIPQRWTLRGLLAGMAAALWMGEPWLLAGLALAAVLPMAHRHRGWTHWPATPWLLAGLLATGWEYQRAQSAWFSQFDWEGVWGLLVDFRWLVFSMVAGHYTHLLLDRTKGGLPFPHSVPAGRPRGRRGNRQ